MRLILLALCTLCASTIYSQTKIEIVQLSEKYQNFSSEGIPLDRYFEIQKEPMGLGDFDEMQYQKSYVGPTGVKHDKFEQTYKSIPIFANTYSLHSIENSVVRATGSYAPKVEVNVTPKISENQALFTAKNEMEGEEFTEFQNVELNIVDKGFPNPSGNYALCYVIELETAQPYDKQQYLIDAHSGHVLFNLPLLVHQAVPGKAHTYWYGEKDVIIDSISSDQYHLHDPTRGNDGITTSDPFQTVYTHESKEWNWQNEGRSQAALDLHWGTAEFYDMMVEYFDWPGLDGNGRSMNGSMLDGQVVNAFWNGEYAAFGIGNCDYGPLTTLEVVAHEFTHGLTDETSQLVYANESGAINESMSDIFGKACEDRSDPGGFDWWLGHSFILNENNVSPFRSFDDPTQFGHPDFYKGALWIDGNGVHTNSSVGNHWFWGLVEGEVGINEVGDPYNIVGVGMDTAIQIVFQTQAAYLSSNSNYNDYYEYSLLAAADLYGAGHPIIDNLKQAWLAVGLPYDGGGGNGYDLALTITELDIGISTCFVNEIITIEYVVHNVGSVTYLPAVEREIEANLSGNISYLAINDTIYAGETDTFSIDMLVNMDGFNFVLGGLTLADDNYGNEFPNFFFLNSTLQGVDLQAIAFSGFLLECPGQPLDLQIQLINNGCVLEAGAEVKFVLKADGIAFDSFEVITSQDLGMNNQIVYPHTIEAEDITGFLEIEVIYTEDLNNGNNELPISTNFYPNNVTGEYLNTFSEVSDLSNGINFIQNLNSSIVDYEGESYLASSGLQAIPGDLCDANINDILEFTDPFGGKTTVFEMCTDLSSLSTIELSFDLMQFRNEALVDFEELDSILTIVRVSYSGNGSGSEIYYHQPVETLLHHEIDLPDFFVGSILFEFINITGENIAYNPDTYLDFDVNLIDNIELRGRSVSTENTEKERSLSVFPNPVSDRLQLDSEIDIKSYRIYSAEGKQVISMRHSSAQSIDVSTLSEGYYILSTQLEDGTSHTIPFVKQ